MSQETERPVIGEQVFVSFNGHKYVGTVREQSRTRDLVRFTTGSGRTRDRWFRSNGLARVGLRVPEAAQPEVGEPVINCTYCARRVLRSQVQWNDDEPSCKRGFGCNVDQGPYTIGDQVAR